MGVDIRLPFFLAAGAAGLAILLVLLLWRAAELQAVVGRRGGE